MLSIWENRVAQGEPLTVRKFKGEDVFRFATTGTEASEMIYRAFFSDYQGCSLAKKHVVLNISLVAEVIANGTCEVVVEELDDSEKQHACIVNANEACKYVDGVFVINQFLGETLDEDYSTANVVALTKQEIEDFLKLVKRQ